MIFDAINVEQSSNNSSNPFLAGETFLSGIIREGLNAT
jgi:hypothetical protein